ncbi:hypothetical protein H072_4387 [Dactylellina haptotyla CBS 200.50]|uniref:Uncharacterized protein n=1 Tax=Dactylellina haptotyla (strain CBS 200.50) TaxID=1284197 RepID=S8AKQ1_DACHA|nr:hypothetical protein H072_4387 [Dactylellina haptotyla CBS 200.50]
MYTSYASRADGKISNAAARNPNAISRPGLKSSLDKNIINQDIANNNWAPWCSGDQTPPNTNWYDWLVPDTILRHKRREEDHCAPLAPDISQSGIGVPTKDVARNKEEEKREELRKKYGDVDYGHCAEAKDWMEIGSCMCTITWRMPGRFPLAYCQTAPNMRPGRRREPESYRPLPPDTRPCWMVQPNPEDPVTRLCWKRNYNMQSKRYEYTAEPWEPSTEKRAPQFGNDNCRDSNYCYENSDLPGIHNTTAAIKNSEEPFTPCSKKPPWLQHVQKFVRAEEIAQPTPPPSEFVTKSGTLLGKLSEAFFSVPFYDVEHRRFRYTNGTEDMSKLKLHFNSKAPLPKPAPRLQKPKPPVKRPLVMPKVKSPPMTVVHPDYKPDYYKPFYDPCRPLIPITPKPAPQPKPTTKWSWFQIPRFTIFPRSPAVPGMNDSPCPPPREKTRRKVRRTRRLKRDDGEYLSSGDSESDGEEKLVDMRSLPEILAAPKKKHKKRRRPKNSDPTYRQHGVREDNRIEKGDLEMMRKSQVKDRNGCPDEEEEDPEKEKAKTKQTVKRIQGQAPPGAINGRETRPATRPATNELHTELGGNSNAVAAPPKKKVTFAPLPSRVRKRKDDDDSEYIPSPDHEKERQERKDVRYMGNRVDTGPFVEDEEEMRVEHQPKPIKQPMPIQPARTQVEPDPKDAGTPKSRAAARRKKIADEDRAFQPGRSSKFVF